MILLKAPEAFLFRFVRYRSEFSYFSKRYKDIRLGYVTREDIDRKRWMEVFLEWAIFSGSTYRFDEEEDWDTLQTEEKVNRLLGFESERLLCGNTYRCERHSMISGAACGISLGKSSKKSKEKHKS
jgi:hypothetical protein